MTLDRQGWINHEHEDTVKSAETMANVSNGHGCLDKLRNDCNYSGISGMNMGSQIKSGRTKNIFKTRPE